MIFTALVLLVLALAAYRITRLVVEDSLTERPRGWMRRRFPLAGDQFAGENSRPKRGKPLYNHTSHPQWVASQDTFVGKLLDCTYCSGAWVSAGVFSAWHWGGPVAWWILVAVAVAGAQALLNALDGRL